MDSRILEKSTQQPHDSLGRTSFRMRRFEHGFVPDLLWLDTWSPVLIFTQSFHWWKIVTWLSNNCCDPDQLLINNVTSRPVCWWRSQSWITTTQHLTFESGKIYIREKLWVEFWSSLTTWFFSDQCFLYQYLPNFGFLETMKACDCGSVWWCY